MTATPPHPMHQDCQKVSQILARIGEKWSMLVVMLLRDGPRRFNDIKRNTGGVSQQMLTRTVWNETAWSPERSSRPALHKSNTG